MNADVVTTQLATLKPGQALVIDPAGTSFVVEAVLSHRGGHLSFYCPREAEVVAHITAQWCVCVAGGWFWGIYNSLASSGPLPLLTLRLKPGADPRTQPPGG